MKPTLTYEVWAWARYNRKQPITARDAWHAGQEIAMYNLTPDDLRTAAEMGQQGEQIDELSLTIEQLNSRIDELEGALRRLRHRYQQALEDDGIDEWPAMHEIDQIAQEALSACQMRAETPQEGEFPTCPHCGCVGQLDTEYGRKGFACLRCNRWYNTPEEEQNRPDRPTPSALPIGDHGGEHGQDTTGAVLIPKGCRADRAGGGTREQDRTE